MKFTQKPTSIKGNPALFRFEDIYEGESPNAWFWFGRKLTYNSGPAGPRNFLGWGMRIMLPLFHFSTDNFSAEEFEEQQGWSVPAFNISLRWNGLKVQMYQHYLGPSKDLNTNPVYDPKTHMSIECWERDETDNYKAVPYWKVIKKEKYRFLTPEELKNGIPDGQIIIHQAKMPSYTYWARGGEPCDCTQCKGD